MADTVADELERLAEADGATFTRSDLPGSGRA
jgi:hypothetical protein